MALCDQAMQILVGPFDRHAAHRNVLAEMLAALGQDNVERARGDFRIGEEQFVEVTHPVEQKAIRIGGFDLDILLHHGRYAAEVIGCFGCYARGRNRGICGRVLRVGHDGTGGFHAAGR